MLHKNTLQSSRFHSFSRCLIMLWLKRKRTMSQYHVPVLHIAFCSLFYYHSYYLYIRKSTNWCTISYCILTLCVCVSNSGTNSVFVAVVTETGDACSTRSVFTNLSIICHTTTLFWNVCFFLQLFRHSICTRLLAYRFKKRYPAFVCTKNDLVTLKKQNY